MPVPLDKPSFGYHFPVRFPDIAVYRGGVRIDGTLTERLDAQFPDEFLQHLFPALVQVAALGAERIAEDVFDGHVMRLVVIRELFLLRHVENLVVRVGAQVLKGRSP